jgi:hypothetical protein
VLFEQGCEAGGGAFDLLTIWGLATGLQERLREQR